MAKLFESACIKHQQGDINSAVELYQQAVQADPNLHTAWRNLGALLRQQGKIQEARHCTEQALKTGQQRRKPLGQLRQRTEGSRTSGGVLQSLSRRAATRSRLQRDYCKGLAISLGHRGEHRQVVELLTPIADEALPFRSW